MLFWVLQWYASVPSFHHDSSTARVRSESLASDWRVIRIFIHNNTTFFSYCQLSLMQVIRIGAVGRTAACCRAPQCCRFRRWPAGQASAHGRTLGGLRRPRSGRQRRGGGGARLEAAVATVCFTRRTGKHSASFFSVFTFTRLSTYVVEAIRGRMAQQADTQAY